MCFECGVQADHAHHVVPRVLGGTKTVNLCSTCHAKIHSPHLLRTSELTKAGLKRKREQGQSTGGTIPFGFCHEKGIVKKVASEQKIIKQMVRMREKGMKPMKIADHFAALGIKNRYSKPMNSKNVQVILKRYDKNEERPDN